MNTAAERQSETSSPSEVSVRRRKRRAWVRLLSYLAFFYALWCVALYVFQDRLIFPTDMTPVPLPTIAFENAEVLTLEIDDGTVEGLFVPAPDCTDANPAPVVFFFHGNAELVDYQDIIVDGYHRLGWSVLLPEYRGYGRCDGHPSQRGIGADMVRFYDTLRTRPDVDPARIVFHGRSLGGGIAADLAARRKPSALILESTFTSLARMGRKYLAPGFLVKHPFRTDRVLPSLAVPVLLFHGTRDELIPIAHGRSLRHLAPNTTYVEFDCGHNDFPGYDNEAAYWEAIEAVLARTRATVSAED